MPKIDRIIVDSSGSRTDLCNLGAKYGTDKSPYNTASHRHPYTAIYNALFSPMRYQTIRFAEIGIWHNSSMRMWREYFSNAYLYGFDVSESLLDQARDAALPDVYYDWLDTDQPQSIARAFEKTGCLFDIIIDDANHFFDNQMTVAAMVHRFLRPGGIFIIEDLHKPWGNERYEQALQPYFRYYSSCSFVEAEHEQKFSEGTEVPWFDNDKLLLMYRNRVPAAPVK